jgi:hypothetical protein
MRVALSILFLNSFFGPLIRQITTGSQSECTHSLQSFGIPASIFPLTEKGEVTHDFNREMWEKRRTLERVKQKVVRVVVPGRYDVLLGRGKGFQQHIGNLRFRHMIEEHFTQYESASKMAKTELTEEVVRIIKETSGRFLKEDSLGWTDVGDDVARLKASHSFRSMRSTTAHNKDGKKPDNHKKSEHPYEHLNSNERESSAPSSKRVKQDPPPILLEEEDNFCLGSDHEQIVCTPAVI